MTGGTSPDTPPYVTILVEGVHGRERRLFRAVFATADQKEGMTAFVGKRPSRSVRR